MSVADTIEHLVGLQAQVPASPYIGLWSRVQGFDPSELSKLIESHRAVRGTLMRVTLHLVTARDYWNLRPIVQRLIEQFAGRIDGIDFDTVAAFGRKLVTERPRGRAEIERCFAERWPHLDAQLLARAFVHVVPLVQVPPRGTWGSNARPLLTTAESFVGPARGPSSMDAVALRYLRAFGPATVADLSAWSRVRGWRPIVEGLRPRLRTFRDEGGRELFDVPNGPLPDADIPVPVRFLPDYDNVLIGHADRNRIFADEDRKRIGVGVPTVLVDGFVRATWRVRARGLVVEPFEALSKKEVRAVREEAEQLTTFLGRTDGVHVTA